MPEYILDFAARQARSVSPDKYWVVARSGQDDIARIEGGDMASVLDVLVRGRKVRVNSHMKNLLESLSKKDRSSAEKVLGTLGESDPSQWKRNAKQMLGKPNYFLLPISPDLLLVVQLEKDGNTVDVLDLLRADVVQGMMGTKGGADAQG
jgi:hypothetical protein